MQDVPVRASDRSVWAFGHLKVSFFLGFEHETQGVAQPLLVSFADGQETAAPGHEAMASTRDPGGPGGSNAVLLGPPYPFSALFWGGRASPY